MRMDDPNEGTGGAFLVWLLDWDGWQPESFETREDADARVSRLARGTIWVMTERVIAANHMSRSGADSGA